MIITFILVFCCVTKICSESISSEEWPNLVQDLSFKIRDYKLDDKKTESRPLDEGFILISDNSKKSPPAKVNSADLLIVNRISTSYNSSTTTCKTITMVKTVNHTLSPTVDHSRGYLSRRLLNEPNFNKDKEILQTTPQADDDDDDAESFMKVDEAELDRQLLNMMAVVEASGYTTEQTSEGTSELISTTTTSLEQTTTTTPLITEPKILSNITQIMITINCTIANETIATILNGFKGAYIYPYNVTFDDDQLQCNGSGNINVTLDFYTDNNMTVINELLKTFKNVTSKDIDAYTVNRCGNNETVLMTNITNCYYINLCSLCGIPPNERGRCPTESVETKCRCFINEDNPPRPYTGERCFESDGPLQSAYSAPLWTPVIVGILAGLAGLLFAITCCLWAVAAWRRRKNPDDLRIQRIWHLPRAEVPPVSADNVPNSISSTISTLSSNPTDSDHNRSSTADSTFFQELDQKMGENLRATIARPNTSSVIASLPSDTMSSALSNYDPIDELDAIIDNEDIDTIFHDSLNDLFEDDDMLEAVNPNVKLPRPNVDSRPTGLFSHFFRNS